MFDGSVSLNEPSNGNSDTMMSIINGLPNINIHRWTIKNRLRSIEYEYWIITFENGTRAQGASHDDEYYVILTFGNGTKVYGESHDDEYWEILKFENGTRHHGVSRDDEYWVILTFGNGTTAHGG